MWRTSSARRKSLPSTMRLPGPRRKGLRGAAMDLFLKLFGDLLVFVYHCFDRIVIHGYLSGLSRPEQVVHFFRRVVGVPVISKEVLSQRTADYQTWVEAFARNHDIPIEWAEKGVRKEDYVQPWLRKMVKKNAFGVFFIFKSMEQGPSFRVTVPKFPTKDPNHRILARQKSRFTHDYFYIRDEVLGPMVMRVATFFPFQTTYYLNGHSFIEQELHRAKIGFRNYAERTIMRSPRREVGPAAGFSLSLLRIIRLATRRAEHSQELVGRAEATGLQRRRRHRAKRFELFAGIGTQVDFGAFQAGVSEPERDFPHVAGRLQRMHGAGMPQHVWTDPLPGDRGNGT